MRLTIQNFWKYDAYATAFFRNHEKQPTESYEVGGSYFFKFKYLDTELKIEVCRDSNGSGWPVKVWAYNYTIGAIMCMEETNVDGHYLSDKDDWCQFIDTLINKVYTKNHNFIKR